MEQVGDGDISTDVGMAGSIVNEFKDGGNSVGDIHTDIGLMHDQGESSLSVTCGDESMYKPTKRIENNFHSTTLIWVASFEEIARPIPIKRK